MYINGTTTWDGKSVQIKGHQCIEFLHTTVKPLDTFGAMIINFRCHVLCREVVLLSECIRPIYRGP